MKFRKLLRVTRMILGGLGVCWSIWLFHGQYLKSRLFEHHAKEIVDGRIAEALYDQESLLAWADLATDLGIFLVSLFLVYLSMSRLLKPCGAKE